MDDFIGITNQPLCLYLLQFSRAMLHGIHALIPSLAQIGHCGADPVSGKKLDQEEGL